MRWLKMSSDSYNHWKIEKLTDGAYRLWGYGLCIAARYETNGHLPKEILAAEPWWPRLKQHTRELVKARLWESVAGGWVVHEWEQHNGYYDEAADMRAKNAERVRRHRERRRATENGSDQGVTPETDTVTEAVAEPETPVTLQPLQGETLLSRYVTPLEEEVEEEKDLTTTTLTDSSDSVADAPDPDAPASPPTEPAEPPESSESSEPPEPPEPAPPKPDPLRGFDEFWATHPRAQGSDASKTKARKAWPAALKRAGGNPQTIIEAAQRLRDDPNLPEQQFIPHAVTWLHQDRWESGPLPTRHNTRAPTAPNRADQFLARAQQLANQRHQLDQGNLL